MLLEIRGTKSNATCGGVYSKCETYKNHPEWNNLKKNYRHIPKGEKALFVDNGDRKYCLCHKHAKEWMNFLEKQIFPIKEQMKILEWVE